MNVASGTWIPCSPSMPCGWRLRATCRAPAVSLPSPPSFVHRLISPRLSAHKALATERTKRAASSSILPRATLGGSDGGRSASEVEQMTMAKDDLRDAVTGSRRGLVKSEHGHKKVLRVVEALEELGRGTTTTGEDLTATWEMLWTTEKETLFILKNAHLFGTEAGRVLQVIDVSKNTLRNVIEFPPTGAFIVDASIRIASSQRVDFRFERAKLRTKDWEIPFPPFGQGWFNVVYMDDEIVISRDIRGDVLILERSKTDWKG